MFGKVSSAVLHGIESTIISVETDINSGMPSFDMVGFLSSEVKEAKERVRSALTNSGYELPVQRLTVNLAPADIRKSGNAYDLPIAVSILCANGDTHCDSSTLIIGELSLDGHVNGISGVLPMVLAAKEHGLKKVILPAANFIEASLVPGMKIIPVNELNDAVRYLNEGIIPACKSSASSENGSAVSCERSALSAADTESECMVTAVKHSASRSASICAPAALAHPTYCSASSENVPDFADIRGQKMVKRACEVAISGMHNILMIGPPGAGKTLIAKCIPSILPPMTMEEQLEISKIYSVSGMFSEREALLNTRPFRSPHHTITEAGLAGGGKDIRPGEISLAHNGVLFLDELPEFSPTTLEVLRQPLEEKKIRIVRANGEYVFPAKFVLVCAMNPCKCGYFPDMSRCRCTRPQILKYLSRISQPLIDRIDITVEAKPLTFSQLDSDRKEESSESIRKRIIRCHEVERQRYQNENFSYNSEIPPGKIPVYCCLEDKDVSFMADIFKAMNLTARTYHKILRVARTIADLDSSEQIKTRHLQEAICYRTCDKKYWENTLSA